MKRITVILFSLLLVILLAGLCSCKQDVSSENSNILDQKKIDAETISEGAADPALTAGVSGVVIPGWHKLEQGYQNIPEAVVNGSGTGLTKALKAGLKNPPKFISANNVIVMVCEGLTSDLINESRSQFGELILDSFPVSGKTVSKFSFGETILADYLRDDLDKSQAGIVAYGDVSSNSMRRMTTKKENTASAGSVYDAQFFLNPPLKFVLGKGNFDDFFQPSSSAYKNEVFKSHGKKVDSLSEAVSLFKNEDVVFVDGDYTETGRVNKLYTIIPGDGEMPSFRQETAFALTWMQDIKDKDGFSLMMSYCPDGNLDANGVQDFDEAVAVAVKFVLENPDTVLLVCGCPADGSEAQVVFYGLGKDVAEHDTLFECVSSLYE